MFDELSIELNSDNISNNYNEFDDLFNLFIIKIK